jgi:hypothetical protein
MYLTLMCSFCIKMFNALLDLLSATNVTSSLIYLYLAASVTLSAEQKLRCFSSSTAKFVYVKSTSNKLR